MMNGSSEVDEQLREACCNGNTDMVHKLMNSGVDVNSQNKMNGWTGLHWAAKRGHASIVSMLLKNNADLSIKNYKGESIVDVAANEKIIDILQKSSINLNNKFEPEVNVNKTTCERNDETKQVNSSTTDNANVNFIPNYLRNPVVPHLQPSGGENMYTSSTVLANDNLLKHDEIHHNKIYDENEVVLKVRLVDTCDFIEIELDSCELTYDNLLNICCTELVVSKDDVMKVRKLPNTILRKDKDVRRLKQYQELELLMDSRF